MTTLSHEPSRLADERPRLRDQVLVPELWASLAIATMWLTVLVVAISGPDIETSSAGGDHVRIPAAVAVAAFAFLGTWVVARHGYRRETGG